MDNSLPSINSLHKEKEQKELSRHEIYKLVLSKCAEKITYTNRHTDKTFVIFEVPKLLIGFPNYDFKSCILYLMNRLASHNYMVEFIDPFYLYIDWGTGAQKYESKPFVKLPSNIVSNGNLKNQTKALLSRFPNTSKVEFIYADSFPKSDKSKKNRNKKKK